MIETRLNPLRQNIVSNAQVIAQSMPPRMATQALTDLGLEKFGGYSFKDWDNSFSYQSSNLDTTTKLLSFSDNSHLMIHKLGTEWMFYPAPLHFDPNAQTCDKTHTNFKPYNTPLAWKRPLLPSDNPHRTYQFLKKGDVYAPYWTKIRSFPYELESPLNTFLWSLAHHISVETQTTTPLSVGLIGGSIYEHSFQLPTAHVDLGSLEQKKHWKQLIGLAIGKWLKQNLPEPLHLSALHHHPQAGAQFLGLSSQENSQISAHQKLKAKQDLIAFL